MSTNVSVSAKVAVIIGASKDRQKFGNKAVRAFCQRGYRVIPIHPHAAEIDGLPAYKTVEDVPVAIDLALVYVPPEIGMGLLDGLAARNIPEVWFNPGAESPALIERAGSLGLRPIVACSIVGIGERPDNY